VLSVSAALRDLALCFLEDFFEESKVRHFKNRDTKRKLENPALQRVGEGGGVNERMETPHCRLGDLFSPIGLVAASLDTCMLTIIGAVARRHGIDLRKTTVKVLKETTSQVAGLNIH
jgi:hypothetical protein